MNFKNPLILSGVVFVSLVFISACGTNQSEELQKEETVIDLFEKADLLGTGANLMMIASGSLMNNNNNCVAHTNTPKSNKKNDIDAINLNILGVKNQSNSAPMEGSAGEYNVLAENFITRILAEANLPAGTSAHMLRLMLAESGHSVVINGTAYALEVPSGEKSGYKLIFKEYDCQIGADDDLLLVDIHFKLIKTHEGYKLRPTAFVYCAHNEEPAQDPDDPCLPDDENPDEDDQNDDDIVAVIP